MSATLSPSTSVEELLRPIARYWWLWAAFGALSIAMLLIGLLGFCPGEHPLSRMRHRPQKTYTVPLVPPVPLG